MAFEWFDDALKISRIFKGQRTSYFIWLSEQSHIIDNASYDNNL